MLLIVNTVADKRVGVVVVRFIAGIVVFRMERVCVLDFL